MDLYRIQQLKKNFLRMFFVRAFLNLRTINAVMSIFYFAHDFWWFAFGMFLYGISFACFSGTDEALVYDTEKELGQEPGTLSKLGKYKAAVTTFKIITPVLGV